VSEGKAENGKSDENSMYNDLMAHRDIVCLPQLRFSGNLIHEYVMLLI